MSGFSCVESNGPTSEAVDAGGGAVEGWGRALKLPPIHLFWEICEEGFELNQVCLLANLMSL